MARREPIYRIPPDFRAKKVSTPLAESLAWPWKFLGIESLWEATRGKKPDGTPVKVAVLDTGIDDTHPEFEGQILNAKDFTGSRHGYRDINGHGTWCCGAVAAKWRNNTGGAGIAPESKLIVAKVLGDNGAGDDRAIARGIEWCVSQGADFLSMSFGGPVKSPMIAFALQSAMVANPKLFPFAASGNDGGPVNYPGALVIGVGASDQQGKITKFTSRGPELDIIAPGFEIVGCAPGGGYQLSSGTSMATPIAVGVAALAYALSPSRFDGMADMETELRNTSAASGSYRLIDPKKFVAVKGPINSKPLLDVVVAGLRVVISWAQ
jgi:subtilisin family serine protease